VALLVDGRLSRAVKLRQNQYGLEADALPKKTEESFPGAAAILGSPT
jgi:hypothetical protein